MPQLILFLFDQLIKIKDSNKRIKLKTVTKLVDLTVIKWWLPLDTDSLIIHKLKAKQKYYQLNKESSSTI